jgi:hypothetical protein
MLFFTNLYERDDIPNGGNRDQVKRTVGSIGAVGAEYYHRRFAAGKL